MLEGIGEALLSVGDYIIDALVSTIGSLLWSVCYALDIALCGITYVVYKVFNVFAGVQNVEFTADGFTQSDTLINVLMRNGTINHVYWDIALIGVALCIGFAIIAVIKKIADIDGKNQQSLTHILLNVGKSILLMLLMTGIVTVAISLSNVLLSSVDAAFDRADYDEENITINFNDEEYAAMARVLNTIGNYSLNTANSSRYNVNACFNAIRADMLWLEDNGVFNYNYVKKDSAGNVIETWQSALMKIYRASGGFNRDISMDAYNDSLSRAIVDVMETIQTNESFRPLSTFTAKATYVSTEDIPFDVLLFMTGTSNAAHVPESNLSPSINDNVRGQYINGEKSIYNLVDVEGDFSIRGIGNPRMQHFLIWITCIVLFLDLMVCVFNAIARVFNVLLLYLVAPLAISTTPLDDGGKFKQWSTAFIIQCFGLLGNVLAMRLFLLFVPIIFNGGIRFFPNGFLNFAAQIFFMIGAGMVTKKASGMITGILADNAGMQSIMAGDASDIADKVMDVGGSIIGGITGASAVKQSITEGWENMKDRGGLVGMAFGREGKDMRNARREKEIKNKLDAEDAKKSGDSGSGSNNQKNMNNTGTKDKPNDNDVVNMKGGPGNGTTPQQQNLNNTGTPEQNNNTGTGTNTQQPTETPQQQNLSQQGEQENQTNNTGTETTQQSTETSQQQNLSQQGEQENQTNNGNQSNLNNSGQNNTQQEDKTENNVQQQPQNMNNTGESEKNNAGSENNAQNYDNLFGKGATAEMEKKRENMDKLFGEGTYEKQMADLRNKNSQNILAQRNNSNLGNKL